MFDSDQPATPTLELLEALRRSEWLAGRASLASRFSHDLGTPLNVILGRVNLILSCEDLPEASARHARLIVEAARSIADGLQAVLDEERLPATPSEVDVGELLRGSIALVAPLATARGVQVVYESALGDDDLRAMMDVPATVNVLTSSLGQSLSTGSESLGITATLETIDRPDDLRCAPGRYVRVTVHGSTPEGEPAVEDPRRAHTHKHLLRALGGFLRSEEQDGKTAISIFLPMRKP